MKLIPARYTLLRYDLMPLLLLGMMSVIQPPVSIHRNTVPPNIILIMADDMGYADIGCFGSEIQTPNLDRMAQKGLRMTQFYNALRCCPTRASVLTGLYPHQAGVGDIVTDRGRAAYPGSKRGIDH